MEKITKSRGRSSAKTSTENTGTEVVEETKAPVNNEVVFEGVKEQEEKVTPAPPKSVRIKMAKDHRCHIGGVFYNLEAGKTYVVPENVKRILSSVGLLLPL